VPYCLCGAIETTPPTSPSNQPISLNAKVAHLQKKEFKPPDKTPVGYDNRPFKLNGSLDLAIMFADHTLHTTVYLKMDARDPLLLSEGACDLLGVTMYHPDVGAPSSVTAVPVVRVKLVESV